jgi:DNA invertase Pin-like site-specific DNA recombinase
VDENRSIKALEPPRRVRCAIYTRKSTEEGLEQAFNSLDAQREAAVAYIQSQKHVGWTLVETHFDDGGFSGGNMERPALQQLLEQIEARQVDCVLVYKVDRLSRSLLDFARLMDRFDQRSVSFVSVTQQFNTTTSLGRLTLNILLSFAQFEREIISERTRDKMGAARRKGKWVGGTPLLGYDVAPAGGSLIVNSSEAHRVQEIFEFYRTHRSLAAVVAELAKRRWTTKSWKSRRDQRHTGRPFTKASVRMLLSNTTYCGKVNYRGVVYQGEHKAIIEPALWENINNDFSVRGIQQPESPKVPQKARLSGLLICKHCQQPMIATYSAKKRHYRYYICQTGREKGWKFCATKSVSADLLEGSILIQLRSQFSDAATRLVFQVSESDWQALLQTDTQVIPEIIHARIEQIHYDGPSGAVQVKLRAPQGFHGDIHTLTFEYKIPRRRGRARPAFRLRAARETLTRPPRLARLLALGHKLEGVIRCGKVKDYAELARLAHISSARIGQIVTLSLLAPAIQEHILFLPAEHAGLIHERELRDIAREPRWGLQRVRFDQLLAARD